MNRPIASVGARKSGTVGWGEAEDIARRIVDGSTHVHAGISGPGGSGKSTLLDELSEALRSDGIVVVRSLDDLTHPDIDQARTALLIDDGEQLSDADLAELATLCRDTGPHMVAAFRPWPRSEALATLSDHLGRQRPLIMLHHLSAIGVRERAAAFLGEPLQEDHVDRLLDTTRGNPRLVDLVLAAVRDEGWDIRESGALPTTVLEHLRHQFDRLDEELFDFLVALAVGFSAPGPILATAPRFARADLRALMAAARGSGMVSPNGSLIPIVRIAILQSTPAHELWAMRRELVDAIEAAGLPLGEAAFELARHGFRDQRVADALRSRADEALVTDPNQAARLYTAAIDAGADEASLAGRRAQAAWGAGDVRGAERLVDGLLTGVEHPDFSRVMNVAAASWARKGMLQCSVDAYLSLHGADGSAAAPLAAVCLAGLGDVERARTVLATAPDVDYPTSSQVAHTLMAEGILSALEGATDRALSSLLQASSVMADSDEAIPLPEVPAVLAAHVALNAGELGIAAGVLQSAVDAAQGGPAFRNRLRLTQALVALRADRPVRARAFLEAAESSQHPLGLRDEILAHAVRIGLARHTDDITSLVRAWNAARQTLARMPIDLAGLPALVELAIAAARLHEAHLVEAHIASAWEMLARVGQPTPWSTNLHWAAIQAAILRNDQQDFAQHTSALLDAAPSSRVATKLAEAGRVWAAALRGEVDVDSVERAVHDLVAAGYPWDAGRLAGHAAARAPEHKDTLQLLALARGLHPEEARIESPHESDDEAPVAQRDDGSLSAREREVARLVLEGKTYAEIGNAIFISPRTAEHHIARIRRRFGVSTRSELLAQLRLALDDGDQGR